MLPFYLSVTVCLFITVTLTFELMTSKSIGSSTGHGQCPCETLAYSFSRRKRILHSVTVIWTFDLIISKSRGHLLAMGNVSTKFHKLKAYSFSSLIDGRTTLHTV